MCWRPADRRLQHMAARVSLPGRMFERLGQSNKAWVEPAMRRLDLPGGVTRYTTRPRWRWTGRAPRRTPRCGRAINTTSPRDALLTSALYPATRGSEGLKGAEMRFCLRNAV